MTPTEKIDAALDSVLRASGTMLINCKIIETKKQMLDPMREAMRKIMVDSYIDGSNDAHEAMKGCKT